MATSVTSKSVSGFDPRSTIPGCVLWLDASQELGSNGTYMNTITDRSPSGYSITATTSNTITLATNYLNGLPVYNFGGNTMIVSNFNWNVSFTIFFVTRGTYGSFLYSQCTGNNNTYINYVDTGNWALIDVAGAFVVEDSVIAQGTSVTGTGWSVFCIGYSAGATTCSPYSVNGTIRTTQTGTATSTQYGTYPLFINGNGTGAGDATYIAEIIHYNQNLTVTQAQQVEGYLVAKWGLQSQLNKYFLPTTIPGCTLWLDASDSSSNGMSFSSGSNISVWKDKSGNGYNATAYSNPTYDTSGKRISVNGGNYFWNTTMPFNLSARTIFLVFEEGSTYGGARGIMGFIPNPPTSGNDWSTNNGMTIESNNGIRFYQNGQYSPYDMGSNPLPKAIYCDTLSGSTGYGLINGSVQRTSTASITFGSSIGYDIAARWDRPDTNAPDAFGISGYFYEIIVFNSALTASQRQQVESYLGKKWGLSTPNVVLPSTHPYYSIKPFSRVFLPPDITGCQLWLDAADLSTLFQDSSFSTPITSDGQTIGGWKDKSGTSHHTTASNKPTFKTGILNNLPITRYSGGTFVTTSGYSFPNNAYSIFVVANLTTNNGNYQRALQGSSSDGVLFLGASTYAVATFTGTGGWQGGVAYNTKPIPAWSAWIIIEMVVNGSTLYPYVSGLAQDPKGNSTTGSFTDVVIGGGGAYSGQPWNGDIAEVIIYNSALSDGDRQKVEGYLAWKWNLKLLSTGTSPSGMSGLQLWVDASTIGSSNGTVLSTSIPNAVSGLSFSFVSSNSNGAGTVTTNTLNGLTVISVSSSQSFRTYSSSLNTNPQFNAFTLIQVIRQTGGANGRVLQGENNNALYGFWSGNKDVLYTEGWISGYNFTSTDTNWNIYTIVRSSSGATNFYNYGGMIASSSSSGAGMNGLTANQGSVAGGELSNFQIAEVILFNTDLSRSVQKNIETYLSNKWGIPLETSIPKTHQFYNIPTSSIYSLPLVLANESTLLVSAKYTGSDQTVSVPAGAYTVYAWGAAGAGGAPGAFIKASINVPASGTLTLIVGQCGQYNSSSAYGGGGIGLNNGAGGGGRTQISLTISGTTTEILTVGSGGGGSTGGYGGASYSGGVFTSVGGTGLGGDGRGGGATISGPGGGGSAFYINGDSGGGGSFHQGGTSGNYTGWGGQAGGGSGYYGGGGGGGSAAYGPGSGGGGSSYYNSTYALISAAAQSTGVSSVTVTGVAYTSYNAAGYTPAIQSASNTGHGLVIILY